MRFHRVESPTQTEKDAATQEQSGELWGRTPRAGAWPKVKAYVGRLPTGVRGVEFETEVEPDAGCPPGIALWTGPRAGVAVEGEYAKIQIRVTSNTQR